MTTKHQLATSLPPVYPPARKRLNENQRAYNRAQAEHNRRAYAYPRLVKVIRILTDPEAFHDQAIDDARALLRELGEE